MNLHEFYMTPEEVAAVLPLNLGDTVLVASDMTSLMEQALNAEKSFDLDQMIDLLQEKVGSEGTLLFPVYNWKFCRGEAWDYNKTRSSTGALSQRALKREDFTRTQHPLYSFAVWGRDAELLHAMHDTNSFVGDTPFNYLHHKDNSLMLTLDVPLHHCFTFIHYVEETERMPYRYLKGFTGPYINEDGMQSIRTYSMYVRYMDADVLDPEDESLENYLIEKGGWHRADYKGHTIRYAKFKNAFDMLAVEAKKGGQRLSSWNPEKLSVVRNIKQENELPRR